MIKQVVAPFDWLITYSDIHDLGDFPQVNEKSNEDADLHHKIGFVVQNVEEDH